MAKRDFHYPGINVTLKNVEVDPEFERAFMNMFPEVSVSPHFDIEGTAEEEPPELEPENKTYGVGWPD